MMKQEYPTSSAQETQNLGKSLAQEILKSGKKGPSFARHKRACPSEAPQERRRAFVLALQGDLGGGKTTFLQGFARGLGIKEKILSPTFVLMKKFGIPNYQLQTPKESKLPTGQATNYQLFYHLDCYRIQNPKEILVLGFKDIITNPQNIVAIEWAEKIKDILPKSTLQVYFRVKGIDKREIKWYNHCVKSG